MEITLNQLVVSTGSTMSIAAGWLKPISDAMKKYEINTAIRIASFLSQIGHESGGLRYVREIWGPTDAQDGYEGRYDLGNTDSGDGKKYRGRGLIQITGRANYQKVSEAFSVDFVKNPELLETFENAAMSAAWFWSTKDLNRKADLGDFVGITKKINGGTNGYKERIDLYNASRKVLGIPL